MVKNDLIWPFVADLLGTREPLSEPEAHETPFIASPMPLTDPCYLAAILKFKFKFTTEAWQKSKSSSVIFFLELYIKA